MIVPSSTAPLSVAGAAADSYVHIGHVISFRDRIRWIRLFDSTHENRVENESNASASRAGSNTEKWWPGVLYRDYRELMRDVHPGTCDILPYLSCFLNTEKFLTPLTTSYENVFYLDDTQFKAYCFLQYDLYKGAVVYLLGCGNAPVVTQQHPITMTPRVTHPQATAISSYGREYFIKHLSHLPILHTKADFDLFNGDGSDVKNYFDFYDDLIHYLSPIISVVSNHASSSSVHQRGKKERQEDGDVGDHHVMEQQKNMLLFAFLILFDSCSSPSVNLWLLTAREQTVLICQSRLSVMVYAKLLYLFQIQFGQIANAVEGDTAAFPHRALQEIYTGLKRQFVHEQKVASSLLRMDNNQTKTTLNPSVSVTNATLIHHDESSPLYIHSQHTKNIQPPARRVTLLPSPTTCITKRMIHVPTSTTLESTSIPLTKNPTMITTRNKSSIPYPHTPSSSCSSSSFGPSMSYHSFPSYVNNDHNNDDDKKSSLVKASNIIHAHEPWNLVWEKLRKQLGWTWKYGNGLVDYFYIRPGGKVKGGIQGIDYFINEVDLQQYIRWAFGWIGPRSLQPKDEEEKHMKDEEEKDDNLYHVEVDSSVREDRNSYNDLSINARNGKRKDYRSIESPNNTDDVDAMSDVSSSDDDDDDPTKIRRHDDWVNVWEKLKRLGFKWKTGTGLIDYYYILPGGKIKGGTEGIDFFTDEERLKEYVKITYGWNRSIKEKCRSHENVSLISKQDILLVKRSSTSDDESSPFSVKKRRIINDRETVDSRFSDVDGMSDKSISSCSSNSNNNIKENDRWQDVWDKLKKQGWCWKTGGGLVAYYYVCPGGRVKGGTEGIDYFIDEKDVKEYVRRTYGWNDGGKCETRKR